MHLHRIMTAALVLLVAIFAAAVTADARGTEALWAALRAPGHFVIMRHALAPGTGDPANFRLDDCSTQRNLSDTGRAQARRAGDAFRAHGIASAAVYSSQWCRCLDTSRLLGLGGVRPMPLLNSFFDERGIGAEQSRQLRDALLAMELSAPVILVTHQVNITGLSGANPGSGEMIVMRRTADDRLETLGSLQP